jgi:hypothetical protein
MKKRLLFVLAIIVALLLIAAAPVSACNKHGRHRHHPPSGDQVMVLNNNPDPTGIPDPGRYGCEEISWFGTIKINGKTFGMALYPVYGSGEPIYTYGEDWKIFTGKFKTDKDGKLKRCKPGRVLMSGYDEGYVDFSTGLPFFFQSDGTVDYAAGYFKRWDGYAVYQDGWIQPEVSVAGLENVFGFHGTFKTYPS